MEKQNVYEKPVTLGNILKFAVSTIAMTMFMPFYTMVDGRTPMTRRATRTGGMKLGR